MEKTIEELKKIEVEKNEILNSLHEKVTKLLNEYHIALDDSVKARQDVYNAEKKAYEKK